MGKGNDGGRGLRDMVSKAEQEEWMKKMLDMRIVFRDSEDKWTEGTTVMEKMVHYQKLYDITLLCMEEAMQKAIKEKEDERS